MDFSQVAPYLKDPLVLVGFFLFLASSFARLTIKRGVIPPLPRTVGFRILKLLLLYGFIIGVLIIVLGFGLKYKELSAEEQKKIGAILQEKLTNKELSEKEQEGITQIIKGEVAKQGEKQSKLQLVDLVVTKDLKFDFKLKNSGDDSAFLTAVEFVFFPGVGVPSVCLPAYYTLYDFPFSASFGDQLIAISKGKQLDKKITIPSPFKNGERVPAFYPNIPPDFKKPFLRSQPLKISQVVPPSGVDRFIVRFVIDKRYREVLRGNDEQCRWHEDYKAYAVIRYDGDHTLTTPYFFVSYYPSDSTN